MGISRYIARIVEQRLTDTPLFISGKELCRWMERICGARGWRYITVVSPSEKILAVFPFLQAENVLKDTFAMLQRERLMVFPDSIKSLTNRLAVSLSDIFDVNLQTEQIL